MTIEQLRDLFVNRSDVYAAQTERGFSKIDLELTNEVLERHLAGQVTLGVYQLSEKSEVKWICFDFDDEEAEMKSLEMFKYVKSTRFSDASLLEFTGGRGFHVWIFFKHLVPGWQGRTIAKKLAEEAAVHCEIFPKQDKIEPGTYGNLVRLPLGIHKKTGKRSIFVAPASLSEVQPTEVPLEEPPKEEEWKQKKHDPYPCWNRMMQGVAEGTRDHVAFALARRMKDMGLTAPMIVNALSEWNMHNKPPLTEQELSIKVRSAFKRSYSVGCSSIQHNETLAQFCDREHCPRGGTTPPEILPEVAEAGKALLDDPELLRTVKALYDVKIAGEDDTKVLLFLLALTTKTHSPQFVVVKGESAAGKSWLVDNVLAPFALTGDLIKYSRVTPHAMEYEDIDFSGKVLFIQELSGIESQEQFRVWNSEHGLRLATVSEHRHAQSIEIKGTPAFFTTTTKYELDPELETRTWTLSPSESDEQTRRILEYEANKRSFPAPDANFQTLAAAIKILQPYPILIPFASKLKDAFPLQVKTRRDFKKFLTLVEIIAFLHQRQRPIALIGEQEFIVATPVDLRYALELGLRFVKNTIINLPDSALEAFDVCVQMETSGKEITEESFAMHCRSSKKKKLLKILSNSGYLYVDESRKPHRYQVLTSPDIITESRLREIYTEIEQMPFEALTGKYALVENPDIAYFCSVLGSERSIWIPRSGSNNAPLESNDDEKSFSGGL
jgi:hypothetical protein